MQRLPAWADVVLIPLMSIIAAFAISALVILYIGENPWEALKIMVDGALGSPYGWGYTLYYATNFMFTGLGGFDRLSRQPVQHRRRGAGDAGRAWRGGGGCWRCLGRTGRWRCLPRCWASIVFGAAWAAIPAWLQARRGSHIVITTMMFNFIGAALLNYVLVNVLRPAGSMDPATARFPDRRASADAL